MTIILSYQLPPVTQPPSAAPVTQPPSAAPVTQPLPSQEPNPLTPQKKNYHHDFPLSSDLQFPF